jgi:hypothetical protein
MSWVADKSTLTASLREIDPAVILTTKDGWFWRALSWLIAVFVDRQAFLTRYATTIGPVQAYPKEWSIEQVLSVGFHESRHTRQARVCGWFVPVLGWIPPLAPWAGLPIMFVLWCLLPIPIFLAWARYRLELDADAHRWKRELERGALAERVAQRADSFAKTVSSKSYGWAVPQCWALWGFRRKLQKVLQEVGKSRPT